MNKILSTPAFIALIFCQQLQAVPQNSILWGPAENPTWDPAAGSLLKDFTDVGYQGNGSAGIPDWPIWMDVTDLGAIPNDGISDVAAFRAALEDCPPNHAIGVPDGRYVIDDVIDVTTNDIVIRGESRDGAILYFPKHMRELYPDLSGSYASYSFINFSGGSNRGIENLSLVFRDEQKATGYVKPTGSSQTDRHWYYSGENPVAFGGGETNSWIRNVYIKNANHAIRVDDIGTQYITVMDIVLDQFIGRTMLDDGTDGHMGIKVGSGVERCLVHNILLTGRYDHDITPMGAKNSVFSRIVGPNVELDHHANGNVDNLFTEVDTGIGGRGYGEDYNNVRETYWGIKGIREASYLPATSESVFVGINTTELTDIGVTYHHETLDPNLLEPANIYLAQMDYFSKTPPVDRVLTLPPHPAGAPLRLHAVDDAMARAGTSESTNFGFESSLGLNNGSGSNARVSFMKFDLGGSGLSSVASAKLRVYVNNIGNGPLALEISEVDDDTWTEATLTYLNKPVAGTVVSNTLLTDSNSWYEIDLTSYVNGELASSDTTISLQFKADAVAGHKDAFSAIQSEEAGHSAELVLHLDSSTVAAPAAPTSLTATPSDQRVTLDWADNSEADFASYNVYRHTGDGIYVIEAMGLTYSDYEDSVVSNSNTYYYKVTAVDTAGTESVFGAEISATPVDINPPAIPTNLSATLDDGYVFLSWDANTEADFASYKVYRSTVSDNYGQAVPSVQTDPSFADSGLANGTTYYYVVTAVDDSNNESAFSLEYAATPANVPVATIAEYTFDGLLDDSSDSDIGTVASAIVDGGGLSIDYANQQTLTDRPALTWTIGAMNDGVILDNDYLAFTITPEPGKTVTFNQLSYSFYFQGNAGAQIYVYSSQDGFSNAIDSNDTGGSGNYNLSLDLSSLATTSSATEIRLYFDTSATFSSGTVRIDSISLTETNDVAAPATPAQLEAMAGIGEVELTWSANSETDFDHYTLYRSETSGSGYSVLEASLATNSYTDTTVSDNTTYHYVLTAWDDSGNQSGYSNQASALPGLVTEVPSAELTVDGSVSGAIADVGASDDSYQTLTEVASGNTSILEHIWTFQVTGAEIVTFYVEAHHSANTEGDDFVFAYSTDEINYTEMLTVSKTADDHTAQYYALPSGLTGTVYVRVHDTDASDGNNQLDSLYIDELVIESAISTVAPDAALEPTPADAAIEVPENTLLSWKAGLGAASHDVYFGTSANPAFQGNQSDTTFDPGSLQVGTTYYWAIDEVNNSGTTAGTVWSFTTIIPGPKLSTGEITGVGDTWQTVPLPYTYNSPVAVATVVLNSASDAPAVARVRNAAGNSLELSVQNPSGATLSGYTVHLMVVEEGAYTAAQNGVNIEAIKVVSNGVNTDNDWSNAQMEVITPVNTYTTPVIFGQVMTANDGKWSSFWSCNGNRNNPATAASIYVGRQVGQDTDTQRADETLGVIIIESGTANIDGLTMTAGVGGDSVRGVEDNAPYTYTLSGLSTATHVALSSAGMDGVDGGWPVLFGASPVSAANLKLAIDEDQNHDAERNHTTEQVSYIVFE